MTDRIKKTPEHYRALGRQRAARHGFANLLDDVAELIGVCISEQASAAARPRRRARPIPGDLAERLAAGESLRALAARYYVSLAQIQRWRDRLAKEADHG